MSDVIVVKCSLNQDLRRFRVSSSIPYEQFVNTVAALYKVPAVVIKYADDEGDLITVSSDEELREAFRFAKSLNPPLLRLSLVCAPLPSLSASTLNNIPSLSESQFNSLNVSVLDNASPSSVSSSLSYSTYSHSQPFQVKGYAHVVSVPSSGPNVFPSIPPSIVLKEEKQAPKASPISVPQSSVSTSTEEWMKNYLKVFNETSARTESVGQQVAQSASDASKRTAQNVESLAQGFSFQSPQEKKDDSLDQWIKNLDQIASSTYQKTSELSESISHHLADPSKQK